MSRPKSEIDMKQFRNSTDQLAIQSPMELVSSSFYKMRAEGFATQN